MNKTLNTQQPNKTFNKLYAQHDKVGNQTQILIKRLNKYCKE